jgi:hypothetical protein
MALQTSLDAIADLIAIFFPGAIKGLEAGIVGPIENAERGVVLPGGGSQVFIDRQIPPEWIKSAGKFGH